MRDSLDKVYRLQLKQSPNQLDPRSLNFQGGDVKEIHLGDHYSYTTGEEKDPGKLYPAFRDALDQGFDESIVVAFKDDQAISGSNPERMIRIPAKVNSKGVTIFKGEILDSKGEPLAAEINLEDLAKGIRIVKAKADEKGKFRIELPNGELYGYFIDLPNYYPVSDIIDLRQFNAETGQPEIVFNKEITLMTVQEIFEQGLAVRINNVFFDFDSDNLRPESHLELDRLARILIENPDLDVEIMGHTDDVGSNEYNQELSKSRARSVMRYLVLSGYPTEKITFRGYGEIRPLAPNDSPEGRQLNRRVEFRFLPAKK
jgi:outer membrane protein OmpA-like peptidoglycan-associated protein